MKIAKCDICGKPAEEYVQIKYRKVKKDAAIKDQRLDMCMECFKKAYDAVTDQT